MELAETEVFSILLDSNEEFRNLAARHRDYEQRIEALSRRRPSSEQDRFKEIDLKKRKLLLKDRMATMIRDYRKEASVAH